MNQKLLFEYFFSKSIYIFISFADRLGGTLDIAFSISSLFKARILSALTSSNSFFFKPRNGSMLASFITALMSLHEYPSYN